MRSLYDFIIEPIGERYANTSKVNGKNLVLNTKIESFKFVNRIAKVIEIPLAFETKIKKGDTVVVHQNIFRRFYNMKGEQQSSRSSFKDNLFINISGMSDNASILVLASSAFPRSFDFTNCSQDSRVTSDQESIIL